MKKAYIKYLTSLLLFGSNGLVASHIALTSYEIVLMRSMLGSLMLAAIFLISGQKLTALQNKRDLLFIALSGFAMAGNWLFLFEAFAQIGVSMGMLINYCGPVIVVATSPLLFGERVTWQRLLALAAAMVGVFFVSGGAAVGGVNLWGLACALLSAVCYAALVDLNKMSKQVKGMENAMLQLCFCFAAVAVFVLCKQGAHLEIARGDWPWILWIGLLNTGICCYLYFSSIGTLPVQTVAVCGYLEPVSALALAAIFLGEKMLPLQILGAVLIIGGALFGECAGKKSGGARSDAA